MASPQKLFEELFPLPKIRARYLEAPLLTERTAYISHLINQGHSQKLVKFTASMQINVIKLLDLRGPRMIQTSQVTEASSRWLMEAGLHKHNKTKGKASPYNLTRIATQWLRFSGLLLKPDAPERPFDPFLKAYVEQMEAMGLSASTIYSRRSNLAKFQIWLEQRHDRLADVCLVDIDDYLDGLRANGLRPKGLLSVSETIRWFFRFCESHNWSKPGISRGIVMPRIVHRQTGPRGPAWRDVRRMLSIPGTSPVELRARAVISLCSIYALRRSEVVQLRLDDLDWYNEIMTVRRAKRGRVQQFPLQYEVGEAILAYLKAGRPKSSCRHLFTTLLAPIRPMTPCSIHSIVANRMKMLRIESEKFGPHALRHACATQLLNRGFSLHEIADFLGHRGLSAVSIYAKYNPRLLRRVAAFSLAEIQ